MQDGDAQPDSSSSVPPKHTLSLCHGGEKEGQKILPRFLPPDHNGVIQCLSVTRKEMFPDDEHDPDKHTMSRVRVSAAGHPEREHDS